MLEFIQANISTIIVSLLLIFISLRIIRKQMKDRKNGRSACSSCNGCSAAPLCTTNNKPGSTINQAPTSLR